MKLVIEKDSDVADFVTLRRDLHAQPELGFKEERTSALVAESLRSWGIEVHAGRRHSTELKVFF